MFGRRRRIKVTILYPTVTPPEERTLRAWMGDELTIHARVVFGNPAGTHGWVEVPVRLRFD